MKPGDPVWWADETGEYHGFIHSLEPASITGEPIANVKLGEGRFKTRLLKNLNHDPNLQPIEDNERTTHTI